jgi:hypothetical protein
VLENNRGEIAAVEVKAGATLRSSDWKWLKKLAEARGQSFRAGIVVYAGDLARCAAQRRKRQLRVSGGSRPRSSGP